MVHCMLIRLILVNYGEFDLVVYRYFKDIYALVFHIGKLGVIFTHMGLLLVI